MKVFEYVRIDDVCDGMKNAERFYQVLNLCFSYKIVPIVGVIPSNTDDKLVDEKSKFLISDLKKFVDSGKIVVALHGFNHNCYSYESKYFIFEDRGGLLRLSDKSEFVGLEYEAQKERIVKGVDILTKTYGVRPKFFFAPSHSYDDITIKVLREQNLMNIDGVNRTPFFYNEVLHIPQCSIFEKKRFSGAYVNCVHFQTLTDKNFERIKNYLRKNNKNFMLDLELLYANVRPQNNYFFRFCYYFRRRIEEVFL